MSNINHGYVYILHFHEKLHHAHHYVGCTHSLKQRLETHATGHGSRLTRSLHASGCTWEVGAVGVTSHDGLRRIERQLKEQGNSSRYCELCNKIAKKIPGTTPYPLQGFTFPTHSALIKPEATADICTVVSPEVDAQWRAFGYPDIASQVKTLMSADRDKLGFIPSGGAQGIVQLIDKGQLVISHARGVVYGYVGFTVGRDAEKANIQQACVRDDCRLRGIGRRMLEELSRANPQVRTMTAKVRNDLAANEFWKSCGFVAEESYIHEKSGSSMICYRKEIDRSNGVTICGMTDEFVDFKPARGESENGN